MSSTAGGLPGDALSAGVFADLLEVHGPALLGYLRRMVGQRELAEDLLQDTFLAAFSHRRTYRSESSVKAWLFTIAANRARNALRDGRWTVADSGAVSRRLESPAASPPTPEDELLRRELGTRLVEAVEGLPHDYREAVILRDIEDLSYAEIAVISGGTEGAARVRVHRARERLRAVLRSYLDSDHAEVDP